MGRVSCRGGVGHVGVGWGGVGHVRWDGWGGSCRGGSGSCRGCGGVGCVMHCWGWVM